MLLKTIFLLFSISLCIAAVDESERVVVASRDMETLHWRLDRTHFSLPKKEKNLALRTQMFSFRVILKRQNTQKLESLFWEVNDPSSPKWGQFLTRKEVDELVSPSAESKIVVKNWLRPFNVKIVEKSDYFEVFCTPAVAQEIFQTQIVPFVKDSKHKVFRIWGDATVPLSVSHHIELITGISELFSGNTKFTHPAPTSFPKFAQPPKAKKQVRDDVEVTPALLRSYYQIPAGQKGSNPANIQAIAAFDDYFSVGALAQFASDQGEPTPNVTISGPNCFLTDQCDQYESDLDVQYITAIGQNIPTNFYNHAQGNWILGWAQEINAVDKPGYVQSVSYGWSELWQCDIATNKCSTLGYNSMQYVAATNVELQKLGAKGVSVLVSDGDDGAASLGGATGFCPMDPNFYCLAGGCQHTYTKCAEFTITLGNAKCNWPMGAGSHACASIINATGQEIISQFFQANPSCNLNLEQDATRNAWFFSDCTCDSLQPATFNGATISGYKPNSQDTQFFTADYPTSSPYVTSVGATQFISSNGQVTKEVGCSIKTGAIITTGGGFSTFQSQFPAQSKAVSDFFANPGGAQFPPSTAYDKTMRAYPDISFVGHKYKVFASTNQDDPTQCPCQDLPVDGTSASSPALAGMLSLINDVLLSKGMSPLGHLTPLLYSIYGSDAYNAVFNDIVEGDNFCTRAYCCKYG